MQGKLNIRKSNYINYQINNSIKKYYRIIYMEAKEVLKILGNICQNLI